MIIRNLPLEELNGRELKIVVSFWVDQTKTKFLDESGNEHTMCEDHNMCKTLEGFWEAHREGDTDYGKFDGWIEGEDTYFMFLEQYKDRLPESLRKDLEKWKCLDKITEDA